MHRLVLENVGPIRDCQIDITQFNVFTGAQASGKSTVAKSIFFFRTIKDDICDCIIKRTTVSHSSTLHKIVLKQLRNKFLQLFGTSRAMRSNLRMIYQYDNSTYIKISLTMKEGVDYISPNYVYFDFSQNIKKFLSDYNSIDLSEQIDLKYEISEKLNDLFCDEFETIFIPAGRSLITLLTNQLNYIFTSMDEDQKRGIDFGTQKYIERILKIRPLFNNGVAGFLDSKHLPSSKKCVELSRKAIQLVDEILKGNYVFANGEERLVLKSNRYVKINYTSSGQQETVWIFNILLYQLINDTKTFIILEEPEAHLYPDAQKKITELLALFLTNGNSILITTHSPYILGTINNLIFAKELSKKANETEVQHIIDKCKQVDNCSAYFVENGTTRSCVNEDDSLIQNEVIDGASQVINDDFNALFNLLPEANTDAF